MSLDTEYASASASIREVAPSTSDPESQFIRLDGAANEIRGLLDVEHGIPPGQDASVISAILYLYKAESWSGAADITLEPLDDPWDPYTATWADQPGVRAESEVVTVPTGGAVGDEIAFDITSLIDTAVASDDASGTRWYGVRITSSASGQRLFYSPLGPEEYRPKLVREYEVVPDAPTIYGPDGEQAVSEVKPLLVLQPSDPNETDAVVTGIQVQVDEVDTFASPHYDSGQVAHSDGLFDTNAPPAGAGAMTALTDGNTYFWRGKLRHGSLWSDWSSVAEFRVQTRGVLSLVAPAGATVDTSTPTITHDFTGTQVQVEVEIERFEDGVWFTHWELPLHVSTLEDHTVPDDYALDEGQQYAAIVRVDDDEDRADLPGDRRLVEVRQEFTVSDSG